MRHRDHAEDRDAGRARRAFGAACAFGLAVGALCACGEGERREARDDLEGRRAALGQRLDEIAEQAARDIAYGVRLLDAGERVGEARAALIELGGLSENEADSAVPDAGATGVVAINLTREEAEALSARLIEVGARAEVVGPAADADGEPATPAPAAVPPRGGSGGTAPDRSEFRKSAASPPGGD